MKGGAQVGAAVAAGYLLGRTRKMRLALMIAAAGATGKLGTSPRELLQQGAKRLAESPELTKIAESVRGELLDAAKTAAVTAASSRLDSLNQRLQDQTGVGRTGRDEQESEDDEDYLDVEPEEEPSEDSQTGEDSGEDTGEDGDTEESDKAESGSEDSDEEPEKPEPPRRRRAAQTRSGRSASGRSASRSGSGRTPARGSDGRAPVRRTRR